MLRPRLASGSAGFRAFSDVVSFFSLPILQLGFSLHVSLTLSCCKWPSCPPGTAEKLGMDPDQLHFGMWGWGPDPPAVWLLPGWAGPEGRLGPSVGWSLLGELWLMNKACPLQRAQQHGGR